jgi:hypothetical protein
LSGSALYRHEVKDGYEQSFTESFVVYLTAKKLGALKKTLPGFDEHLPEKCWGFLLLFGAEQ